MKEIYEAVDEIIELIRQSSQEKNAWHEIVSRCNPDGTIEMQFCRLVENAIQKYLAIASETDKRDIYSITKSESGDAADTDIRWIDFALSENLLEEVMDRAFEESKNS